MKYFFGNWGISLCFFLFGMSFYHYFIRESLFISNLSSSSQSSSSRYGNLTCAHVLFYTLLQRFITKRNHFCHSFLKSAAQLDISLSEVIKGPLKQNDGRLIQYIINNGYLNTPSLPSTPYNFSNPHIQDPSMGQSKMVLKALGAKRQGFFIECGALDGELRSNTLILERKYGWKGLLIEGDPKNFQLLQSKKRKAWSSNVCLATKPYPHQVLFQQNFNRGRISTKSILFPFPSSRIPPTPGNYALVQCFPLYSLLLALRLNSNEGGLKIKNHTSSASSAAAFEDDEKPIIVDYFSLDVEGSELDVLRTIPWDKVEMRVLSVEYLHDKGGREAVAQFMISKGYSIFGQINDPLGRNWVNDLIFINNKLQHDEHKMLKT